MKSGKPERARTNTNETKVWGRHTGIGGMWKEARRRTRVNRVFKLGTVSSSTAFDRDGVCADVTRPVVYDNAKR